MNLITPRYGHSDTGRAHPPHSAEGMPVSSDASLPVLDSTALLCASREVLIRHGSETYRLRLTRHDRLILTK